jgi:hypothetical protein
MNDTAGTVTTQDAGVTECRGQIHRTPAFRRRERQRSMRPVPVVVIDEHPKDPLKVRLVQDKEPVEALPTGGAHKPLGNRVGLWRAKRCPNDRNSVASEDLIKPLGEFSDPDHESKTGSVPNGPPAPTTRAAPAG